MLDVFDVIIEIREEFHESTQEELFQAHDFFGVLSPFENQECFINRFEF